MISLLVSVVLTLQDHPDQHPTIVEAARRLAAARGTSEIRVVLTADSQNADLICGCRTIRPGLVRRFLRAVF